MGYLAQQQPSGHTSAGVSDPAGANQPHGVNPIPNSNTSQFRPQVARKAVPIRKPVGGTNATAPKPQNTSANAPVNAVHDSVPRLSSINTNLPNVSTVLSSTPQPQIQATNGLPAGWSSALDANGRVYYINHITNQSSWNHPIHSQSALPLGWEERTNLDGSVYYFNTHTQGWSWDRPCGDAERRRSSVISPGTLMRQGSVSTVTSGLTSPDSSVLGDTLSPLTSGPTSPTASTFQNPFFPSTSGLSSSTSSAPGDNGMISPDIEWESPQYPTKQSRRRSQFSFSSLSSASSTTARKLHLNSIPAPHLPANTPASVRQSVDMGKKGGKIAADYGMKGVKLVAKGAKNPKTRKTLSVGIKGFKVVNGIVKIATGISLGAEFLPDLDLLPDGILDGGDGGGDVEGLDAGDADVDGGDVGDATDGVEADTSGIDAGVDGADVDGASVESAEVDTGVFVGVDTIEVDTVEVDTVEVDTVEVDTVEVDTVEVDTVEVDTVEVDTVEVDTVEVSTVEVDTVEVDTTKVDTVEVDTVEVETTEVDTAGVETIVTSDVIVQETYEQVDPGYIEEVDVAFWYIPGIDDDDERRRQYNQQMAHPNNPMQYAPHHPPYYPPYQMSPTGHPQTIYPQALHPQALHPQALHPQALHPQALHPQTFHPQAPYPQAPHPQAIRPQAIHPHSQPILRPQLATKSIVVPGQVDMPAPLTIRPRRKEMPIATIHETVHPPVSAAETEPRALKESGDPETKHPINSVDPKVVQATEISPPVHELSVPAPQEKISSPAPHDDKSKSSQRDKNEDDAIGFDISSFTGDPFWTRNNGYLGDHSGTKYDLTEKEVIHQAPQHAIEKD